jgi:hypothetical protein
MSFNSKLTPEDAVNDLMIGNRDCVANAGASSVLV